MKNYTFPKIRRSGMLLLALLAFGQIAWAQGLSGTGTSDDPYLINDSIDWNWFAQSVTNNSTYANQFVSLNNDITVSTMAGIENKCFSGTFDGQGHTITLDMTATMQFTALFCYADGATFRNLKVDGVLNTSKKFCAGLVGAVVYNGCTFTNCVSDVTINSTVNGDGSHGGFVSFLWRANTFEGCAFTGKLLGPSTTNVGGFVGFTETNQNGSVTFTNCLFIPEEVTMSGNGSQTFARWRSGNSAVTIGANCYYSQTLGTAQGKMMHSITGIKGAAVTFYGNDNTTYNMSGIYAYSTGVLYDSTCYAGYDETVSLTLFNFGQPGYTYGTDYVANAGSLEQVSGMNGPTPYFYYTLTMPDEDVTIAPVITAATVSVEATPNIYGAVQVSLDNTNWGSSVSAPVGDPVYFKFNTPNGYAFDPLGLHIHTEEGNPVNHTGSQFTMPASNVTIHANFLDIGGAIGDVYIVILSPGIGGGNPIIFNSSILPIADNAASAENLQFYHVGNDTIGFKLDNDYCPNSFTRPEGYITFNGWSNNDGFNTLTSLETTFTAQWGVLVSYIDGDGEIHTCDDFTVLTGSETTLTSGWYVVDHDITYNHTITLNGDVTLILCNGRTMTSNTSHLAIYGNNHTLTIYGQSLDSNETGTLNLNCTGNEQTIKVTTYIQHSGNVIVSNTNQTPIYTSSFTINGGCIHASGGDNGITTTNTMTFNGGTVTTNAHMAGIDSWNELIINGGTITTICQEFGIFGIMMIVNGGSIYASSYFHGIESEAMIINGGTIISNSNDWGFYSNTTIVNGGKVKTNNIYAPTCLLFGWTNADDYILVDSYENYEGIVAVKNGQAFYYQNGNNDVIVSDTLNEGQINEIAGKTLRPYIVPATVTKDIAGYGNGNGGWHLIASPLLNAIDPATVGNLIADSAAHFDLYSFDQAKPLEWRNFKSDSTFRLEACKGYLYANTDTVTLTFNGVPYFGNGKVTLTKTTGAQLEGWNLIGNPSITEKTIAKPFYRMNALGTEIIAAENNIVEAMEGIFVVAETDGEVVTFTDVPRENSQGEERIVLNLSGPSSAVIDRAIIRFGEGPTLPKSQIGNNSTKLYIPQDGKDYALVNVGGDGVHNVFTMDVHFKAAENGTYTLTANIDKAETTYLHLIDSLTSTDVDLLATPTYTFTATTHDDASRFRLVFNAQSK